MIPGAEIDAFDFDGLRSRDRRHVTDLNDAAVIHPEDEPHLAQLLP